VYSRRTRHARRRVRQAARPRCRGGSVLGNRLRRLAQRSSSAAGGSRIREGRCLKQVASALLSRGSCRQAVAARQQAMLSGYYAQRTPVRCSGARGQRTGTSHRAARAALRIRQAVLRSCVRRARRAACGAQVRGSSSKAYHVISIHSTTSLAFIIHRASEKGDRRTIRTHIHVMKPLKEAPRAGGRTHAP